MGAIPPERAGAAAKILAKPADYKVCEGCGSIVLKKALLCPNCHAYRFDESTPLVIKQAELLGSREAASVTKEDYN
jgi:NADH pyrophosphatase NudC (nudix superfamily)